MLIPLISLVNVCVWEPNRLSVYGNVGCVGNYRCREIFCWKDGNVVGGGGSGWKGEKVDDGGGWKGGKVGGGGKHGCWWGVVGGGGCGGGCCEKNDSGEGGHGGDERLLLLLLLLNSCPSFNLFNLFLIINLSLAVQVYFL